jgi:hypothetical protein
MTKPPNISEREGQRRAWQRAMSIRAFCEIFDIGRTSVYGEIKAGRLKVRKAGRRTLIGDDDAEEWWRSLPAIKRDSFQEASDARWAAPGAKAESQANSNIEPGEERRAKRRL